CRRRRSSTCTWTTDHSRLVGASSVRRTLLRTGRRAGPPARSVHRHREPACVGERRKRLRIGFCWRIGGRPFRACSPPYTFTRRWPHTPALSYRREGRTGASPVRPVNKGRRETP